MTSFRVSALLLMLSVVLAAICLLLGDAGFSVPNEFILWQLRLPRVLLGITAGAVLALAGAVYQILFTNPLATPSTVGTTAGATLGAWFVISLSATATTFAVMLGAFSGALAVTLLVAAAAASGRIRISEILLLGIAISLASGAIASGLQFTADMMTTFQAVRWSLGSIAVVGYQKVLWLVPLALLVIPAMLLPWRALDALAGGEDRAHAVGVNVRLLRTALLTAGSLGVAGVVAVCGPIAFVGLIVPHMARLAWPGTRRQNLWRSAWIGGVFLMLCDALARSAVTGRDIPVGVITAALGAPVIVWLVLRRR